MVGIVDKLRNYAEKHALHEADRLLAMEAAEEIESLRFKLNFMEERFGRIHWDAISNGDRDHG